MAVPSLRLAARAARLSEGFDRIRADIGVPVGFPADARREADQAAARAAGAGWRRDLDLVTIDPPGSRDLDQAVLIERRGRGFRAWYAIADVASFVAPRGPLDDATRARGLTVYMPDRRAPLHPDSIGEGAASLLPGVDRPALLWTIELDEEGREADVAIERAVVRSRRALTYAEAQEAIDASRDDALTALRDVGRLRLAREAERGGVSRNLRRPHHGRGGVGLFRTLAPARQRALDGLRHSARALGVSWPEGASYPEVVRGLDPSRPGEAAFAVRASRATGGAGDAAWRVGETFEAVVVDVRDDRPVVQIADPAVQAPLDREGPRPGEEIRVRLLAADPDGRRVVLIPA